MDKIEVQCDLKQGVEVLAFIGGLRGGLVEEEVQMECQAEWCCGWVGEELTRTADCAGALAAVQPFQEALPQRCLFPLTSPLQLRASKAA